MRWPGSSPSDDGPDRRKQVSWAESLNKTDWSHYAEPRNYIPGLLVAGVAYGARLVYKRALRRIPSSGHIRPDQFRQKSIFGTVTSVGDGDNFRLFHTPGGRLGGWGWLRRVPTKREGLTAQTLHVRIAGVDAPELAHFGRPSQPYGQEAKDWLSAYLLNRQVRAVIHRRDQYERVVASVFMRRWLFKKDVGLEMLKAGMATVYEAKFGSEFGNAEAKYREAMETAKKKKMGMWADSGLASRQLGANNEQKMESPREFKTRMQALESEKSGKK